MSQKIRLSKRSSNIIATLNSGKNFCQKARLPFPNSQSIIHTTFAVMCSHKCSSENGIMSIIWINPPPAFCEITEHIASLNSYCQVMTEPVSLCGITRCFDQTAGYCSQDDSSGLNIHFHGFDRNNIESNWCASARAAYLRRLRSSAHFASVPASLAGLR